MSTKLIQKKFLKGTREFEIVDDQVKIRIKSGPKEENRSVAPWTIRSIPRSGSRPCQTILWN